MIEVVDLSKRYGGQTVLDQVTLAAAQGEVLGLVGPNGAGKSTLLAAIAGIIEPDSGHVRIAGKSLLRKPGGLAGMVGYVPQEIALYPSLSVGDNLRFWGRLGRVSGRHLADRMAEIARLTGLSAVLATRVETLSGGMKRKLNLAVALLADPPVLILDEPTAGIDIQSVREITAFIRAQAQAGKTVVYTTHSYDEMERLCDRVALLHQGRCRFVGSLAQARLAATPMVGAGHSLEEVFACLGGW
ncbi:MAG: ABC transporter ATP-binding protein [Bacillota bacterium]